MAKKLFKNDHKMIIKPEVRKLISQDDFIGLPYTASSSYSYHLQGQQNFFSAVMKMRTNYKNAAIWNRGQFSPPHQGSVCVLDAWGKCQ